jgi:hypothetical protein
MTMVKREIKQDNIATSSFEQWHRSSFTFRWCLVLISAGTPAVLTEISVVFLSLSKKIPG